MKIFFTAEYNEEELKPLYEMGDVVLDGWALGLPKMEEDELVKKTKDADIIITSYDDITRRVIEGAPNLKLIACTRATPVNVDMELQSKEESPDSVYTWKKLRFHSRDDNRSDAFYRKKDSDGIQSIKRRKIYRQPGCT